MDSVIQLVELKKSYAGFEIKGQYVSQSKFFDSNTLILLKITPNEFHFFDTKKPFSCTKVSIDIPSSELISDYIKFDKNHIVISTYGMQQPNQLKLYFYNLINQSSKLIYEEAFENSIADLIRVKVFNKKIYVINPFSKELVILNKGGKLVENIKFNLPSDIYYNVVETKRYATVEEFNRVGIDPTKSTTVVDFTILDEHLYLIISQHEKRKTYGRQLVKCSLKDVNGTSYPETDQKPIHFAPNNHIFCYYEKDSLQYVEIKPMKEVIDESFIH